MICISHQIKVTPEIDRSSCFTCLAIILFCSLLTLSASSLASITRVVYPAGEIADDTRYRDVTELLCTAMEKTRATYGDYECLPNKHFMPKKRFLQELESSDPTINVIWNPTSEVMEKRFLAIRIPLRKGLLGYRVGLILRKNQARINQLKTVDDLKSIALGQGVGWNDNLIYEAHGIPVVEAQYSQLFKMLSARRFDMLMRGVGEILPEFERNKTDNPEMEVEQNLLIYYPFPYYFFFNRKDVALKKRVEAGLRMMISDGSFDAIFYKHYQTAIDRLNLKGRRVIRLNNPSLPKDTPLNDVKLWYLPAR